MKPARNPALAFLARVPRIVAMAAGSIAVSSCNQPPGITGPACALAFDVTGPRLAPTSKGGVVASPGASIVRASNGNYYSTESRGHVMLEWDPAGGLVRAFGKASSVTGAVQPATTSLMIFKDSLFAASSTLDVFDSAGRYVRRSPVHAQLNIPGAMQILDDGNILIGYVTPRTTGNYFSVLDQNDHMLSRFDPMDAYDSTTLKRLASTRFVAYTGGTTFWAAPRPGPPDGMRFEQWSTDGRLLDSMSFVLPWFPSQRNTSPDIGYRILTVHQDSSGDILVIALSRNAKYKSYFDTGIFPTDDMYDRHYIVIDPSSKTVKAEGTFDDPATLPAGFFGSSRTGYRFVPNPRGESVYEIVSYRLVDRTSGQASGVCR